MATATFERDSYCLSVSPSLRDGLLVRIPVTAFTLDGFRKWALSPAFPEHVRATFVKGEIFLDMSNEDPELHVAVKTEIILGVGPIVRAKKLGKLYGDGLRVSNEEAEVSNNPDASFLSKKSLRSGKARVIERPDQPGQYLEIVGTPDWVLEVISNSSVVKDTERLRIAYHRAGISEYWLIDARGEEIIFTILLWRKAGYVAAPMKDGWQKSKVFGHEFRLTRQQDEFGLWDYTLETRSV